MESLCAYDRVGQDTIIYQGRLNTSSGLITWFAFSTWKIDSDLGSLCWMFVELCSNSMGRAEMKGFMEQKPASWLYRYSTHVLLSWIWKLILQGDINTTLEIQLTHILKKYVNEGNFWAKQRHNLHLWFHVFHFCWRKESGFERELL